MNADFHYYATYCAAILAGYNYQEALRIAYADNFVDCCSKALLENHGATGMASTVQTQTELLSLNSDISGIQEITRVWSSFHFLPGNLEAKVEHASLTYLHKYQLICRPNGKLLKETVELAKWEGLEAAGLAMHVLSDTWAHQYFAGTPSLVINDSNSYFFEILDVDGKEVEKRIRFHHNPAVKDDIVNSVYVNSIHYSNELNIMNLGHGRVGHLPDYSFAKYCYLPAWGDFKELVKDNPSDYMHAFKQMVYALKYLKDAIPEFELDHYDEESVAPYEKRIDGIIRKRQMDSSADWKAFGEELTGKEIPPFDVNAYPEEYEKSANKDESPWGQFIFAALRQKSMVTNRIYNTGSLLAGYSTEYVEGKRPIQKDFRSLLAYMKKNKRRRRRKHE